MRNRSRRQFIRQLGASGLAASLTASIVTGESTARACNPETAGGACPLDGRWHFRLDPEKAGESQKWYVAETPADGWTEVTVPHTWQVHPESANYLGVAWYRRVFDAPADWAGKTVRAEFEAVYHSATVWLNGQPLGQHLRRGYTAFTLDIAAALRPGGPNTLVVKVDNTFDKQMLPRGRSFDWTPDGGIVRPVRLLITPPTFIERVDVDAQPDLESAKAAIDVSVVLRNATREPVKVAVSYVVVEDDTDRVMLRQKRADAVALRAESTAEVPLPGATLPSPRLWHFDHPHLYRLEVLIERDSKPLHRYETTFGVRKIEVKHCGFYLNGERVRLMGVERMGGSHPDYGMAEPASLILNDHNDMKELNAVFSRVHWQQDRRVLDYCDRHGIFMQVEIPSWGAETFAGMSGEPAPEIMENGLEQLREMIHRDRNHPCILSWGLCNEVNGQNPPAHQFAQRLYAEAKRLDPSRLCSYASNSLTSKIAKDVAGEMDFIEWNEYYESWNGGDVGDMKRNLEEIHRTFPAKPIVISEYGYCECTPGFSGGDVRRIEVLRNHTAAFRARDYVAGAIFFCYNDYRTHLGDKGIGVLRQRVHGVVDLYGARKPSFEALRREASPVRDLQLKMEEGSLTATVVTQTGLPAYTLTGYRLRWIAYSAADIPMEQAEAPLPPLAPGQGAKVKLDIQEKNAARVRVDVMRPTGFSAAAADWKF